MVVERFSTASNGGVIWLCICACGNITYVRSCALKSGHTKSCGRCPINIYKIKDNICFGKTSKGQTFKFDAKFLEIVTQYTWSMDKKKRVYTNVSKKKSLRLHSLIMKTPKGLQVDHINHDPSDNRVKNLRIVTQQQNIFNTPVRSDNKTGYKGVWFNKQAQKYQGTIVLNGQSFYLGVYNTPKEAAKAYNRKAQELFGEYAFLNPV